MDFIKNIPNWDPVYKTLLGLATVITLWFGIFSWPFIVFVAGPIAFKIYVKLTCGKTSSTRRIDGKVAIVTGSNVGIGFETAKDLAKRGGKVIMACRNLDKAKKAVEEIKKEFPNADLTVMKLDLSSMKSVREFSKKILAEQTRLDILVNNAGAAMEKKIITEDKLEANFAANHFGPFLLTNLLLVLLRKTEKSRIVMVSSDMHNLVKHLDLDNLNAEKSFQTDMVYSRTKLANILFTRELDRRFREAGIKDLTVNAIHPGLVKTSFSRYSEEILHRAILTRIFSLFAKTVQEGAQTQIHLAVAEEVEELSGLYWADCVEKGISVTAQNVKLAKDLWERSAQAVDLKPEETIF